MHLATHQEGGISSLPLLTSLAQCSYNPIKKKIFSYTWQIFFLKAEAVQESLAGELESKNKFPDCTSMDGLIISFASVPCIAMHVTICGSMCTSV